MVQGRVMPKQEIQGELQNIPKMEDLNPIKIGVNIRNMRQTKKQKVLDHHNTTLYAKW